MRTPQRIVLILALGFLMPLFQVGIFLYRFSNELNTNQLIEALVFAPAGLISAWYLTTLLPNTVHGTHKTLLFVGWFVSLPFALAGSLIGGLLLPIWIGPPLFGLLPLMSGVWLFHRMGKSMQDPTLRR
jgi:hypothetical protein